MLEFWVCFFPIFFSFLTAALLWTEEFKQPEDEQSAMYVFFNVDDIPSFKQACACVQLCSWSFAVNVYNLFHSIVNIWIHSWN